MSSEFSLENEGFLWTNDDNEAMRLNRNPDGTSKWLIAEAWKAFLHSRIEPKYREIGVQKEVPKYDGEWKKTRLTN